MPTPAQACTLSADEPIGTSSNEALSCNSATLDHLLNSTRETTTNRVGNIVETIHSINSRLDSVINIVDTEFFIELTERKISAYPGFDSGSLSDYGSVTDTVTTMKDYGEL